jgi:type VI secretion system protein ImpK
MPGYSSPTAETTLTRVDRLPILFQELITAAVRIRAARQPVQDVELFRRQIRQGLTAAQEDAHRRGYATQDGFRAAQAVVAFLDETILNSGNPAFRDWPRQPLGPDYFQQHVAGEIVFHNIRDLLTGEDSPHVADLLEVYMLCLLLGYRGRFGGGREADVKLIVDRIAEKINRIRGSSPLLLPDWRIDETVAAPVDPWWKPLRTAAIVAGGLLVVCLAVYIVFLRSQASSL